MSSRALIVEFLGLPGAGKSTLTRRVATLLRERGIASEDALIRYPSWRAVPLRKAAQALRTAVPYACRSALAISASGQRTVADFAKELHNWLFISSLMTDGHAAGEVRLFDQGIFQALWSIAYSAKAGAMTDLVTELHAVMPRPDVVMVIRASLPTIQRRLAARPRAISRLERVAPTPAVLAKAESLLMETERAAARISPLWGGPRVFSVDNDDDGALDRAALQICDLINQIYRQENPAMSLAQHR